MITDGHYELVYSIANERCPWWILGVGLVPVLAGVLLLVIGKRAGTFAIVGGIVWAALAAPTALRCRALHQALEAGRTQMVEGEVRHFRPIPRTGHDLESFEVSGRKFSYSDYIMASGFHQSASHGGPI